MTREDEQNRRHVQEGYGGADYYALMTETFHKLLLEKRVLASEDVDKVVAALEAPNVEWGAKIVARAWRDPAYERPAFGGWVRRGCRTWIYHQGSEAGRREEHANAPQLDCLHLVQLLSALAPGAAPMVVYF